MMKNTIGRHESLKNGKDIHEHHPSENMNRNIKLVYNFIIRRLKYKKQSRKIFH